MPAFTPWGWIHRPTSLLGWLITIAAVFFVLQVFWIIDHQSHSVSDTLYGLYPYAVPTAMLWHWIAGKFSHSR